MKGLFAGNTANVDLGGMQGPAVFSTGGTFLTEDNKVGFDVAKVSDVLVKLRERSRRARACCWATTPTGGTRPP